MCDVPQRVEPIAMMMDMHVGYEIYCCRCSTDELYMEYYTLRNYTNGDLV
jgi:hypothetical protein